MSGGEGEAEEIPEELKEGSTFGSRDDDSDPFRNQREQEEADDEEPEEEADPLEELVGILVEVRDGDQTPSIGCRDDLFAAYLAHLKENPERMEELGEKLSEQLEYPPAVDYDEKAGFIKLLLRAGLQETLPEEYDFISEANAEYGRRNA